MFTLDIGDNRGRDPWIHHRAPPFAPGAPQHCQHSRRDLGSGEIHPLEWELERDFQSPKSTEEAEGSPRNPIRHTFPGCCPSASGAARRPRARAVASAARMINMPQRPCAALAQRRSSANRRSCATCGGLPRLKSRTGAAPSVGGAPWVSTRSSWALHGYTRQIGSAMVSLRRGRGPTTPPPLIDPCTFPGTVRQRSSPVALDRRQRAALVHIGHGAWGLGVCGP